MYLYYWTLFEVRHISILNNAHCFLKNALCLGCKMISIFHMPPINNQQTVMTDHYLPYEVNMSTNIVYGNVIGFWQWNLCKQSAMMQFIIIQLMTAIVLCGHCWSSLSSCVGAWSIPWDNWFVSLCIICWCGYQPLQVPIIVLQCLTQEVGCMLTALGNYVVKACKRWGRYACNIVVCTNVVITYPEQMYTVNMCWWQLIC